MARYLVTRLMLACVVVVLVSTFLSVIVLLVPGDPTVRILGERATPELIATTREEMMLDDPVYEQVWGFLSRAVQGDFGRDFISRVPVADLIGAALPHTIILAVTSLLVSCIVGIPLGVYAASRRNTLADQLVGALSISFMALPSFVAGLFLLLIFAVELQLLPASGAGSFSDPVDYARHLILPVTALAFVWVGYLSRLVRATMLEVLGSNYIRVAHAFGVKERVIVYRLALKNAVIPVVALLGVGLGNLLAGAFFVELIFTRPGLGTLAVDAIQARNFTVVRADVLIIAVIFVAANLAADLSYRMLDPRIRVEEA